jgi:hypothetical protein
MRNGAIPNHRHSSRMPRLLYGKAAVRRKVAGLIGVCPEEKWANLISQNSGRNVEMLTN